MPLAMVTATAEEVDVSLYKEAAEDVGGEADKVEENTENEVVEEAAAYMKIGLTFNMSPITFKKNSGPYSQTRQEKG